MTYRLPALNGLKAFEASARNMSFKTAADELGVTPGAVSQLVKKLEMTLGVALFRRLPRGLLLTPEGETYYPKVAAAFEMLTDATESVAPDLNSRKFSLGICDEIYDRLPAGWARSSDALSRNVRDVVRGADIEMIWARQVDALVMYRTGPYRDLSVRDVAASQEITQGRGLVYVSVNGLIRCRQADEIILALQEALEAPRLVSGAT